MLLVSGNGILANELLKLSTDDLPITILSKREMDITDEYKVSDVIKSFMMKPDYPKYFVHTAALTKPMRVNDKNPIMSMSTNIVGTANVARICYKYGIKFIYISTDFVYDSEKVYRGKWTPDVYEGAPTAITAFFAIVPKLAGIALIYRFCLEPFGEFTEEWRQIIIFLSIASMFVGAIAAIVQTNLKRLLAYSSIGHTGYLLIGLASANSMGIKGLLIYITIYLLMNVGIFTVILSLKIKDRYVEYLSDLSGMSKKKPIFSLCIAIVMFSLAGIPPFAGFLENFIYLLQPSNQG